jgi:hypothetical protein
VDSVTSDVKQSEKQLYMAVVRGEIRARLKGRLLRPERLEQLGNLVHDPDSRFALPPDLELSVEDVKRNWAVD